MAEPMNPFAAVLTPGTLAARRQAEFDARYSDQPFWTREAAGYGKQIKDIFRSKGKMLTPEDEKAARNQMIVQDASQAVARKVEAGELTPEEAQTYAVKQTMLAFLAEGDYEAAAGLAPAVRAAEERQAELEKLRSERDRQFAAATKDLTAAGVDAARAGPLMELDAAKRERELAEARYKDRMPQAKGGAGLKGELNKSDIASYVNRGAASMGLFRRMGQLVDVVLQNPGIGSDAAATLGAVVDQTKGATQLARSTALPLEIQQDNAVIAGAEPQIAKLYETKRGDFNGSLGSFQSLTMDVAYTLAKTRDPGGRLSDADIANAMRILGAAGDSERMAKVFREVVGNAYQDMMDMRNAHPMYAAQDVNAGIDEAWSSFNKGLEKWEKAPKQKATGQTGGLQVGETRGGVTRIK